MVDFEYADLFKKDSVDKQLLISFDGGAITNSELHSNNFELKESLCSEERLRFGACEASSIKFKISNIFIPLKSKWLTVTETLDGNTDVSFQFGKYKVLSDKPTADRRHRDVEAYDAMYDIIKAEVSTWYNTILPDADSTVTLKEFRDSFFAHFGIEQETVELVNDAMVVTRTIEPSKLSGKTVATAICEINGCFGHIGRDGKFQYVFLKEMVDGLYPSDTLFPSDNLFPRDAVNAETISKSHYISAKYEDFTTAKINKLQIRQEEDDIGRIYPDTEPSENDNCYIVQDNFLVYGKSSKELQTIAANLYSVIHTVTYRPAHVEAKGNPCLEVGDGIRLATTHEIIRTYILQRTLKGIQALRDTYDAEGEQYQSENVNSVHEEIIQLRGKTNKLTRTIEETRSEITDMEEGLSTRITQNAEAIVAEAQRAVNAENLLSSKITQSADSIRLEVTQRTSVYNEQINTLQGGMDGSIDFSFFIKDDSAIETTMQGKQCINSGSGDPIGGTYLIQDVSIPAGTYKFSYEWLRNSGFYINASVQITNLSVPDLDEGHNLYFKDLGEAWPELDVWHKESVQISLTKTSRIRFQAFYSAPIGYEDRVNSLYLTNIALYGTAQSVADAVADVKAELMLQSDQIALKVSRDNIISEINQTAEQITISASKIDLNGLVNAKEFVSKYATITELNATTANLEYLIGQKATIKELDVTTANLEYLIGQKASIEQLNAINATVENLKVEKLDASEFTAEKISAKGITVDVANIKGTLSANKISAGSMTINGTTITSNWTAKEVVVGISEKTTSNGYMTDIKLKTAWIYFLGA